MATDHSFKYRGHHLHCGPLAMADGRFGAQVVVAEESGDVALDHRFPVLDCFLTEAEAVAHGRAVGERFVDEKQGTT